MQHKTTTYLKDYQPPLFHITATTLDVDIVARNRVVIQATSKIQRLGNHQAALRLDGEALTIVSILLNSAVLRPDQYQVDASGLTVDTPLNTFTLCITTEVNPEANKALSGLFCSNQVICTQCEAEGFRRITYFIDRPDNMTLFRCTIKANRAQYPVLLSNGNQISHGELDGGRHFTTWEDPFVKPSYLFALVAGPLSVVSDTFTTQSGRLVDCRIYVEPGYEGQCDFAMKSLHNAMRWDEEAFGREYDLSVFNIVAVADFNMGAMENKSLNIFNAKYILADPATATDDDFMAIEGVVAHEYFHNWTGNRVTCRDWFQLSLKEGLTVYRDQKFSADMNNADVVRIGDVRVLRSYQFPEDSGPMAHSVQPDAYIEINNFYTMTVYHKGAEINHMLAALLGQNGFRRGCDCYFERHDGQAVTIHEWLHALADANHTDLTQFALWYQQAGTPVVRITDRYDPATSQLHLRLKQYCPPTPGQTEKHPLHIPLKVGFLTQQGEEMVATPTTLLELKAREQQFTFTVPERPILSLNRGFSAPIKLNYDYTREQLLILFEHDTDGFAQWEAGQRVFTQDLISMLETSTQTLDDIVLDPSLTAVLSSILNNTAIDDALKALLISPPSYQSLIEHVTIIQPRQLVDVLSHYRCLLGQALADTLVSVYHDLAQQTPASDHLARANRALKNVILTLLMDSKHAMSVDLCVKQFEQATTMSDQYGALQAIHLRENAATKTLLHQFYQQWSQSPLVIDKWFSAQAASHHPAVFQQVKQLCEHPDFTWQNPNRVHALLGVFAVANPKYFHESSGQVYAFYREKITEIDQFNPQLAARLVNNFCHWSRFEAKCRDAQKAQLAILAKQKGLSDDVVEIVTKSLAAQ